MLGSCVLSSWEMLLQCDQFSHRQLPVVDQNLIFSQHSGRVTNHQYSMKSKVPSGRVAVPLAIRPGDLVYLYGDRNKSRARDRYLVSSVDGSWCNIKKFTGAQLRRTSYRVSLVESSLLQQLCNLYGIVKSCTTPYHPEGNGQCKRFNRTLHNLLRTLTVSNKRDWHMCLPHVLYCYNTTPHQSTGESPFFLMFGQEPRLPLNFLLRRVESPVGGSIHEWVQEHQARLHVAFEGAQGRLKHAADRRKRVHDQHVRDLPLQEGQLVYLRDFRTRGPQKTLDRWSSVKYRVLRMPKEDGSVYTIVPVDNEPKVRQVHCTMLKAVVGLDSPRHASSHNLSPRDKPSPEEEPSFEFDLLVLDQ